MYHFSMKYLKSQNLYKSEIETKLNEAVADAFGNDITWGGSLLGRLINSSIRKLKIGYNYTKVNNLVNLVKEELNALLGVYLPDDKQKEEFGNLLARRILEKIYNESTGDKDVKEKLEILLGTPTTEGLIDQVIEEVKKVEMPNKEVLIQKLEKFKEDLLKLKEEGDKEKGETSGSEDEKSKAAKVFYQNSKNLLIAVSRIHLDIKNNTVKLDIKVSDNVGVRAGTFFDEEKYKKMRTNSVNDVNAKLAEAKKAVTIFTTKKDQGKINFYTQEVKNLTKRLETLQGKKVTPKPEAEKPGESSIPESMIYLMNEASANIKDQELHAKAAWKKVVNAYNKSGISKFIPYIDSLINATGIDKIKESKVKILEIGRQVVINYDNVGKPISFDELITEEQGPSVNDVAKSISLFGRVLLAFSEDLGLLGAYGASGDTGGATNHIKLFVTSFNEMNKSYPVIKKESVILDYSSFVLIKEADEDNVDLDESDTDKNEPVEDTKETTTEVEGDSVKKSWFKFFKPGEEKEWKVTDSDVKLREDIEKSADKEVNLKASDAVNDDHIIKIVNLFGRAYRLYATDYIPSGRPGGIISQKTLREYEYIGKGSTRTQPSGTGISVDFGPWAAKRVYDKWQDGITKLLEDKYYRKILANIKFVSEAESTTGTPMDQKTQRSGKTLFSFINDMLAHEGYFKNHRQDIFRKYFGVESSTSGGEIENLDKTPRFDPSIPKEDQGDKNDPFFSSAVDTFKTKNLKLSNLNDKVLKVTTDNAVFIVYPFKSAKDGEWVMFKYQVSSKDNPSQSLVTDALKEKKLKIESIEDKKVNGIQYKSKMDFNVGYAIMKGNTFTVGNKFVFKYVSLDNVGDVKDYTMNVKKIEYLVVPTNFKDRKGVEKQQLDLWTIKKLPAPYLIPNEKNDDILKSFQSSK